MATSGRYRAGLGGRLGVLPKELDGVNAARGAGLDRASGLVWLHAVSVGEVLAAERLVNELGKALPDYLIVVSTTTAAGYKVAGERLGVPVFYFPLDFAFAVKRYLRALQPSLFVTMESELWPRMLVECERAGVPVAVVNARVSDRSFPRYMRLRRLWRPLLGKVSIFLAQGEETAGRLRAIGVGAERIRVTGNLKYDLKEVSSNKVAAILKRARGTSRLIVAGSTLEGEESMLLSAWPRILRGGKDFVMIIAPRHPQRFEEVWAALVRSGYHCIRFTQWRNDETPFRGGTIVLLDTIGDLASIYAAATTTFIGGSLVAKGGHNPLEAARFGKPIVMGKSYENFREIVEGMGTICLIEPQQLAEAIISSTRHGQKYGRRGKAFYNRQAGATANTVEALVELVR